jgi:hypothetical protein
VQTFFGYIGAPVEFPRVNGISGIEKIDIVLQDIL